MRSYPKWFFATINTIVATLFVSGCMLATITLDLRLEWDIPWRLDGGQRVSVAALHCLLAFVMLGILGALWSMHMRFNWRHHKHRGSGLGLVILWLLLMLTGVGIYYLGSEWAAFTASMAHLGTGLLVVFWYGWHVWLGRKTA